MKLDDVLTATREVVDPDTAAIERGREAMVAAFDQDLAIRARITRRRLRRGVLTGAVVLVAAAAVVVVVSRPDAERLPEVVATPAPTPRVVEVEYANAAQIVNAAAAATADMTDELGDAPYWKVSSEYAQFDSDSSEDSSSGTRTIWQGIQGAGVLKDSQFGEEIVEMEQSALYLDGRSYSWREVNDGALSRAQIRALLTQGEDNTGNKPGRAPHEWYFVKQVGELLGDTPAAPTVRHAIWEELATVSGATTAGKVVDARGREGWDLTYKAKGYGSQRFIVDPTSGAILQYEVRNAGTTYIVTYLSAEPANSAPKPDPLGPGEKGLE